MKKSGKARKGEEGGQKKVWKSTLRGGLKRRLGRGRLVSGSTEEKVYDFVCKRPGLCTYDIQKKLKMSGGRVRHALQQLNNRGLVKFRFVRKSPRIKKLSYPVDAWKLVPAGLKRVARTVVQRKNAKKK